MCNGWTKRAEAYAKKSLSLENLGGLTQKEAKWLPEACTSEMNCECVSKTVHKIPHIDVQAISIIPSVSAVGKFLKALDLGGVGLRWSMRN